MGGWARCGRPLPTRRARPESARSRRRRPAADDRGGATPPGGGPLRRGRQRGGFQARRPSGAGMATARPARWTPKTPETAVPTSVCDGCAPPHHICLSASNYMGVTTCAVLEVGIAGSSSLMPRGPWSSRSPSPGNRLATLAPRLGDTVSPIASASRAPRSHQTPDQLRPGIMPTVRSDEDPRGARRCATRPTSRPGREGAPSSSRRSAAPGRRCGQPAAPSRRTRWVTRGRGDRDHRHRRTTGLLRPAPAADVGKLLDHLHVPAG